MDFLKVHSTDVCTVLLFKINFYFQKNQSNKEPPKEKTEVILSTILYRFQLLVAVFLNWLHA